MNHIIAVAGDWHINTEWAIAALKAVAESGVSEVQHVGDFGFDSTPRGVAYLDTLNAFCETHNIAINVTLGNHENFPFVEAEFSILNDEGFLTSDTWNNIRVIPRGHRWSRDNTTFVSLGGANSINRYSLTPNIDWWAEEQISLGDVYRTVAEGHADIMLTHDCPVSTPFAVDNDNAWPAEAVMYSRESQMMVEQAVSAVKPKILFHGHHHTFHDLMVPIHDGEKIYEQRVVGLNRDLYDRNVVLLDVVTLDYKILEW